MINYNIDEINSRLIDQLKLKLETEILKMVLKREPDQHDRNLLSTKMDDMGNISVYYGMTKIGFVELNTVFNGDNYQHSIQATFKPY